MKCRERLQQFLDHHGMADIGTLPGLTRRPTHAARTPPAPPQDPIITVGDSEGPHLRTGLLLQVRSSFGRRRSHLERSQGTLAWRSCWT